MMSDRDDHIIQLRDNLKARERQLKILKQELVEKTSQISSLTSSEADLSEKIKVSESQLDARNLEIQELQKVLGLVENFIGNLLKNVKIVKVFTKSILLNVVAATKKIESQKF